MTVATHAEQAPGSAAPDWSAALHTVIDHQPVAALVRGLRPEQIPTLRPAGWRPGEAFAAHATETGTPPADPGVLLADPAALVEFVRRQSASDRRTAEPARRIARWRADLRSMVALWERTPALDDEPLVQLLSRSLVRPAACTGTAAELVDRFAGELTTSLPAQSPGERPPGEGAGPVRRTVTAALAQVCGHSTGDVRGSIVEEIERWSDPGFLPAPPPWAAISGHPWIEVVTELVGQLPREPPLPVGEALGRLVATSGLGYAISSADPPDGWKDVITDAAFQPLGLLGAGQRGAGVFLAPRAATEQPLSRRSLADLLVYACHEIFPGHAVHLEQLAAAGAKGWLQALVRPPAWFEGAGVCAETAAVAIWADPIVTRRVRFHRLRRLVGAASLTLPYGGQTGRWVADRLYRVGEIRALVLERAQPNLQSTVYAYGGAMVSNRPGLLAP